MNYREILHKQLSELQEIQRYHFIQKNPNEYYKISKLILDIICELNNNDNKGNIFRSTNFHDCCRMC